jgi:RimJ/RimL family protein N-acetyltransferase
MIFAGGRQYITESIGYELSDCAYFIAKTNPEQVPIAVAGFDNYNGHAVELFLWSDNGITRDFLRRIGEYAWDECRVRRVKCTIAADRGEWLETVKRLGFKEWGIEPGGYDGSIDNVHLTLVREDWKL